MQDGKNVVLIGMPGVGKSTVGVLLAKRLGYGFLDTDIVLQSREERTLHEIIRAEGPARFRALEERHVLSLDCRSCVIATGGSVVYSDVAMGHLRRSGIVIFLDIPLDALVRRLDDIDARGVVRLPGQTLADLYGERRPLYLKHHDMAVPTENLTPGQVLMAIVRGLSGERR